MTIATLRIVTSDGSVTVVHDAVSVMYTKVCPYCGASFDTDDPRKIYNRDSCKTLTSYYHLNRYVKE